MSDHWRRFFLLWNCCLHRLVLILQSKLSDYYLRMRGLLESDVFNGVCLSSMFKLKDTTQPIPYPSGLAPPPGPIPPPVP